MEIRSYRVETADAGDCDEFGPPRWTYSITGDRQEWSDLDGDGDADVIRQGQRLSLRSRHEWNVDREWVSVDLDGDLGAFAALTVLSSIAPWAFGSGLNPAQVWDVAPPPPSDGGAVTVPLAPDDPSHGAIEYTFDPDGSLTRVIYTPLGADAAARITITELSSTEGRSPDLPEDAAPLVDLPAAEWVLLHAATSCSSPASRARSECVNQIVGQRTVGEWLSQNDDPAFAAMVPACV